MLPDIERAIRLQILDDRVAVLTKEIAALPGHIAVIEKKLETRTRRRLDADRAALTANQKGPENRLDVDIQNQRRRSLKLKAQMMDAKTNEQYRAFQHEIDFCQQEIGRHRSKRWS